MSDTAETRRQMGDMLRLATVASVEGALCMVAFTQGGDQLGPFPWFVGMAGATAVWSKPSVGEQVLLLCPEADIEAGLVLRGLFSTAFSPPSNDDVEMIHFADDAVIKYDTASHRLDIALPDGGEVYIGGDLVVEGTIFASGKVSTDDAIDAAGKITSDDDVIAAGKSLKTHIHTGVQGGPGVSGPPQ